jgi:1-acyl-sn-glycerol-3-phosphate acyltransferase
LCDLLRAEHAYRTAPGRAWFRFGPLGGLRSFCFHCRVLLVYHVARRLIRKGVLGLEDYAGRSYASLRAAEGAGGVVEVDGLAHLAGVAGPVVFVGNHMSTLETLLLPGLILPFKDVAFVVKQSLLDYPIFGPIMRAVKHIPVARVNPRDDLKAVLTQGEAMLKDGVSVVIFPQATRSVVFDAGEFNTLGVKLAARAGVPVVPMALKTDFMANGRVFKDLGYVNPGLTIHFVFGAPMEAKGSGKDAHETVVNFIAGHLRRWGGQVKGV